MLTQDDFNYYKQYKKIYSKAITAAEKLRNNNVLQRSRKEIQHDLENYFKDYLKHK